MTGSALQQDRPGLGILFMIATMALLVGMDTISRHLSQTYSVFQIIWIRFLIFAVFAFFFVGGWSGTKKALKAQRPGLQIARSLLLLVEISTFIFALRFLPVADVHAVAASTPLIVTALAAPVLGEKNDWRQWLAVTVGFLGVLVIIRPGFRTFEWTHLIPVAGAVLWGCYQIMTRLTGRYDGHRTTLVITAFTGAVVSSAIGPFFWKTPTTEVWLLLLLAGILGASGHTALILAMRFASASTLQPFNYMLVLFAAFFGYLVFREFPDRYTIAGAAIVILVGLYVISRQKRPPAVPVPPEQ